ncbi:M-phase inducer phosphatase 3 isoform X5 [Nannospalax galili]|uniref:M-phase inducer phosphatase 3 isoform X5 n=1 Tax=Nannospalax galili TaxID=1026970 RepID=UPI00111BD853|nr:M-phase inducer phosphatase 3 isoform X5 [Nannospalax galili]
MSTGLVPFTREEARSVSGPSFKSSQRKMLHLLLESENSFTVCPDFPKSPGDKLLDSANLSILSGGTPRHCLDLLNLSSGEMSATQFTTSANLHETGPLDSSGPHEVQLVGKNHPQDLMKGIPVQLLCSTPNALDHGHRRKDATYSISANKENVNTTLEWQVPGTLRFQSRPGDPLVSPLSVLDNRNLVENEMKYLGSPITTVPKLVKNLKLEDQEEISDELMEFSLEDQEGTKVAALLSGKYQGLIEKFYIIDCRYPYEYLGGHIQGALNLYCQKELYDFFLKKPVVPLDFQKRIIIIFHCEFSSERGPRMYRFLREEDRALNKYPALHYPELYILKGGYRDFFPEYMKLCEPQSYCPMHHQDHQAELLRCRNQSKAQEEEWQLQEQIALLVKDVSP